jgi:hypothetical protein
MAAMIATQYATEKAAKAIEHSDEAIQKLKLDFSQNL